MEMLPDMGRLQPQARELEEAVLGALMLEKDAYSIVSEILKPECFYEKAHEKIYAAIVDLALSQRPVDMLTVTEQLKKRGELEDVGGPFYILSTYQQGGQQRPYRVSRPYHRPEISGEGVDLFHGDDPRKGI